MSNMSIITDKSYREWISELSVRYQRSQIKAATAVNSEMLRFYWSLGHDIVTMDAENTYGSRFYKTLSADLRLELPNAKGFSVSNLKYMRRFYELYNRQQVADDLTTGKAGEIRQQVADELEATRSNAVFQIPWGHHCLLLDKCKSDTNKALFYVEQTLKNNWSRAVLQNWLDTDLYERQGKAITNFSLTLPAPQSDLAKEMTRDDFDRKGLIFLPLNVLKFL